MNQPKVAAIACQDLIGGIGLNSGDLPWDKHKEDMAFFKQTTQNSVCIMGRNTYLNLLKQKHITQNDDDPIFKNLYPLLKKRQSIVVTHDPTKLKQYSHPLGDIVHSIDHAYAVDSIEKAYECAKDILKSIVDDGTLGEWNNIFFIGGKRIYQECAQYVDTLYLNVIHHTYPADVFFPQHAYKDFKQTGYNRLSDDLHTYTFTKDK